MVGDVKAPEVIVLDSSISLGERPSVMRGTNNCANRAGDSRAAGKDLAGGVRGGGYAPVMNLPTDAAEERKKLNLRLYDRI